MATYNGHNEDSSGNILLSIGNGMAATVETGSTASQAYTKGALLFFNNRLCKATKAISSGATLAVGTNLSQTSLGAELTSHLRSSDGKEFYFDVKDGTYGYYPSASKVSSEFVPFGGTSPTILTGTISSTGSASITFDLSDYTVKTDLSNVLCYISSYNGNLSGTGGGINGYLSKSYNTSTKVLTVTRTSDAYGVTINVSNIVVIIF